MAPRALRGPESSPRSLFAVRSRTGVSGSAMLYRALRELKRPVEYVRYPGEGHDLSRTGNPRHRVDRLLRIVEFFERFDE